MSPHPNQTRAEFDEEEALHYRAQIRKLADMAMNVASDIHDEATAIPEPGKPKPDCTVQFERVSRTVRRCALVARKLAEPLPQPRPAQTPDHPLDRAASRKRIIREVEDAIHRRNRTHGVDIEPLEAELLDRLDRPDLEHDIASIPIEQIIADLARDLGVGTPPDEKFFLWKPRTQHDIAVLETRAAAPLPTEPRPPRRSARTTLPKRRPLELPEHDAEAVAMVLAAGNIPDG